MNTINKHFKLSWGKGILITYLGFVSGIAFLVYRSTVEKIDLVTDNYYEKTLIYQKQIDKLNNTMSLMKKIKIEYPDIEENSYLNITYPIKPDKGEIVFYRPSDASSDFSIDVSADECLLQKIDLKHVKKGLWKLKFEWSSSGVEYFQEEVILIQ